MTFISRTPFSVILLIGTFFFMSNLLNAQPGVNIEERIKELNKINTKVEQYIEEQGGYSYWGQRFLEASENLVSALELYDNHSREELREAKRSFAWNAYYFWKSLSLNSELQKMMEGPAFWYPLY